MDKHYAIFDMDGTLVDSLPVWERLAGEYLKSKGISRIPAHVLQAIETMTLSQSAQLFREEFALTGDPEGEMTALLERHYREDIPLLPGVAAHLETLSRRGVRMCVASATAQPLMEWCLKRLGIFGYFDFLLSCEEVGAGKDRPDVYFEAARRLGAAPGEIAVYEDAAYAMETARAAGFAIVNLKEEFL